MQELANGMLASAAENAQLQSLPSRQRFHLLQSVILTFVEQGRHMVEGKDADAVSLLDNAFKLITGHLVRSMPLNKHPSTCEIQQCVNVIVLHTF